MPCRTPIASRRVRLRVARLVVLVGAAFLLGERNGHLRRGRQFPASPEFPRQNRPHGCRRSFRQYLPTTEAVSGPPQAREICAGHPAKPRAFRAPLLTMQQTSIYAGPGQHRVARVHGRHAVTIPLGR